MIMILRVIILFPTGGFVGPADGVTALPIDLLRPIDTVLTDFSCTTLFNCTNMTMMGTCPNNNYAVITCQKGQ